MEKGNTIDYINGIRSFKDVIIGSPNDVLKMTSFNVRWSILISCHHRVIGIFFCREPYIFGFHDWSLSAKITGNLQGELS